ncbi:phosphatidylserine/phosphatidylglycerophosphate/cardiolipin synthase-like enzyme [Rhodovulum iodosum]|uniref:Phosphatidylserine/phosphatidylglycerophosphate/ cardiolipin synthase-like enzyme n=1 Tax=Rhodovulum iodosum TaxID=68291 RepID=A0ABV3XSP2_9RHOB|nr:phospholipase [Rhodovulum robiginosum]RSK30539.1 phospholipase [Rhodovulum robiginosum]
MTDPRAAGAAVDPRRGETGPVTRFDVLVTAAEAYPALEREFLAAENTISASFRVFDLSTRLRSDAARKIGEDWFDLLVHTLRRGVRVRMVLSDFDPIGADDLHRLCWRARRWFAAAAELAGEGGLEVISDCHPAEAGAGARLVLAPGAFGRLRGVIGKLNALPEAKRARYLSEAPGLAALVRPGRDGVAPRAALPRLFPATHHQKMAVFDERRLYIGGLDLNERRYDTPGHRRAPHSTWHDLQAMVEGPVVAAATAHLEGFLDAVAGRRAPPPPAPGFLRTLSRRARRAPFRFSPVPMVRELERAHFARIAEARQLIYMETQFFRHLPLARALARRARACPDLCLILLVPAAPEDVAFEDNRGLDARYGEHLQQRCLDVIRDGFGQRRMLVVSPVQSRPHPGDGRETLEAAPLVYVHSKLSIFDDRAAILSSANLNGRSLCWDSEAGLELTEPDQLAHLRRRAMGHWLPDPVEDAALAPATAFGRWVALAERNARAAPSERQGFLVPYDSQPAREIALPAPGVPDAMV